MAKPKKKSELRPYAWEKVAFLEDANEDSTVTASAFRVLQKICAAFNRKAGYSECARSFIVDRVPISAKTVQRSRQALLSEGRITIVREPLGRASTRYGVNWYFRGADSVRAANDGAAILDIRTHSVEGPLASPSVAVEGTLASPQNETNVPSTDRRGDMMSPKPFLSLKEKRNATGAAGALPLRAAPPAVAGFGVRQIVGSEVSAEDGETVLELTLRREDGTEYPFSICVEAPEKDRQDEGQAELEQLSIALGLGSIEDPADLIGQRFLMVGPRQFGAEPMCSKRLLNNDVAHRARRRVRK